MSAVELVGKLRERGAQLEVIRGDLKVGVRPGVLTPELTKVVIANKAEILELLNEEAAVSVITTLRTQLQPFLQPPTTTRSITTLLQ